MVLLRCAALVCFAAFSALAQLQIVVKDSSGQPMAATVVVESAAGGSKKTSRAGEQIVLEPGPYRVTVSRAGFVSQKLQVVMERDKPLVETVTLAVGGVAYQLDVVGTAPLSGVDRQRDKIPSPVQTASQYDAEASGAVDLSDLLNKRLAGVYVNEIQGNPFQADLNYRGYTASPLLGTPQGISIYLDAVRLNQPFGDVVSWDLIPRIAVEEVTLIPGSNPLFGLNTLGGAVSLRTKDGLTQPGTRLQLSGGSFGRKVADIEQGGSNRHGFHWYGATTLFFEDGWRESSPTNVRQFFGRAGWQGGRTSLGLSAMYANNSLSGNGLQEMRMFSLGWSSVYTKPDITKHKAPMLNFNLRRTLTPNASLAANVYYRHIGATTFNGDSNEGSFDQSVYQPSAADIRALTAAGYTGFPTSGANAANTPFPFWRCIAQALQRDEPGEKCNGLLNRSRTGQDNAGAAGQISLNRGANQFTGGAAWDRSWVDFTQTTQLGYINPDRSITGINAYADGVTGGNVDGEPFDNRVNLSGAIQTASVFATDTVRVGGRWNLTASGRFNRTTVDNADRIRPSGAGSLSGQHSFARFNPAAGFTVRAAGGMNLYASYSEGSRAPTSVELGCADPNEPCKLPNAMAGDPPLKQVVTRTFEAGVRGGLETVRLNYSLGFFLTQNRDDILFVASEQTGFGYFKNFGKTRRQGVESSLNWSWKRLMLGGNYTYLEATFQSAEELMGTGNSTSSEGFGLEGFINVKPGSRIPLTPAHMLKAYAEIQPVKRLSIDLNMVAVSRSFARGNENNSHTPDGRYYLGPGTSPGYGVMNLGARFEVVRQVELFVQANNLLDKRYYTAAQLGATGFTGNGTFVARPLPAVSGQFPVVQSTFYAPGAPRAAWAGLRLRF